MRHSKLVLAVILTAIAMLILLPSVSWADDSATTFKTKCAACHGTDGLSNTPMGKKQNIPSFTSDKVQKSSTAEIEDFILNGGKEKKASHSFASKGISKDDGAKLAAYVKDLGKKK